MQRSMYVFYVCMWICKYICIKSERIRDDCKKKEEKNNRYMNNGFITVANAIKAGHTNVHNCYRKYNK